MLGGGYLCYEGAEKIAHLWMPAADHGADAHVVVDDPAHLEESNVSGAIKTDFILSAEIMTITLAAIPESTFWLEATTLALVGVAITVIVYGGVAVIVKADDVGLHLGQEGRLAATRAVGRAMVRGMPGFLTALTTVGTAAMLWVGGSIVVHGLEVLGFGWLGHSIHDLAVAAGHAVPQAPAAVEWLVTAAVDGVFGLALGLALIPVTKTVIAPAMALFARKP
ncbi:MAG TPA: DUF808 family protein, partial [Paracoccaceae bacterium]|nr:DUF808 family protein [Paracoccaceae bacterium]